MSNIYIFYFKILIYNFIFFKIGFACAGANHSEIYKLENLNVDSNYVTLSGFSAGGAMVNNIHMAHSSLFSGAAIFSQVFYRCGPNSLIEFGIRCTEILGLKIPFLFYNVAKAIEDAKEYERINLIDSLDNLKDHKIFIWTGTEDESLPEEMVIKNVDFYNYFVANSSQIKAILAKDVKHLFPTDSFGDSCDKLADKNYYLGNCNYSGAYHLFHFLLGENNIIKPEGQFFDTTALLKFNQSEFHPVNIKKAAMGRIGFVYIPKKCKNPNLNEKCFLHINFHGCNEWPPEIAEKYIIHSGFLPIAEKNNIVVLFPLTTKTDANMGGCWDFFSHTGNLFATREGKQVKIVYQMIQRILHGSEF